MWPVSTASIFCVSSGSALTFLGSGITSPSVDFFPPSECQGVRHGLRSAVAGHAIGITVRPHFAVLPPDFGKRSLIPRTLSGTLRSTRRSRRRLKRSRLLCTLPRGSGTMASSSRRTHAMSLDSDSPLPPARAQVHLGYRALQAARGMEKAGVLGSTECSHMHTVQ